MGALVAISGIVIMVVLSATVATHGITRDTFWLCVTVLWLGTVLAWRKDG